MFYEPSKSDHGLPHDPLLAIVSPRPIGWITTLSSSGDINLAPYSFFNVFSVHPPIVGFSSHGWKHSVANIDQTKEFVCNLATWNLIEQVNLTSIEAPAGWDEMRLAGLTAAPSRMIAPPRVAQSPSALECIWIETIRLKGGNGQSSNDYLVLGEVVGVYVEDEYIVDGVFDITATRSLSRCGYRDFSSVESVRSIPRPSLVQMHELKPTLNK